MRPDDVQRVETYFGVTLPKRYVQFLLTCSYDGDVCDVHLDADQLIRENAALRATDYWSDRYFAIGGDGCGNIWCLDIENPSPQVWTWEHDPPDGFSVAFDDMDRLFKCYGA